MVHGLERRPQTGLSQLRLCVAVDVEGHGATVDDDRELLSWQMGHADVRSTPNVANRTESGDAPKWKALEEEAVNRSDDRSLNAVSPPHPQRTSSSVTARLHHHRITCRSEGFNLVSVEQRHATRANAQRARQARQTNELASDFPKFVTLPKRTLTPLTVRRWPSPSCKPIVLSWTARWWV